MNLNRYPKSSLYKLKRDRTMKMLSSSEEEPRGSPSHRRDKSHGGVTSIIINEAQHLQYVSQQRPIIKPPLPLLQSTAITTSSGPQEEEVHRTPSSSPLLSPPSTSSEPLSSSTTTTVVATAAAVPEIHPHHFRRMMQELLQQKRSQHPAILHFLS